jgi:hypothetical protein
MFPPLEDSPASSAMNFLRVCLSPNIYRVFEVTEPEVYIAMK